MPQTQSNGHYLAPVKTSVKAAHVNMMTDTIIANMPPEGLRSIMRGLLGIDPSMTKKFNELATKYLTESQSASTPTLFHTNSYRSAPKPVLFQIQGRYRCLMGCGYGFETVKILTDVIRQAEHLSWDEREKEGQDLLEALATIDGDIVQAMTAIQKELLTTSGVRKMSSSEVTKLADLSAALRTCKDLADAEGKEFVFERGLSSLARLEGLPSPKITSMTPRSGAFKSGKSGLETFKLGSATVPRMFMGLWQFSSPSWGTASKSKINSDFRKHADAGFTAYDMADHYGDAEVTFGAFRSSQPDTDKIYCATKWAVFEPIEVSKEVAEANITERLTNIAAQEIELLQFHWQDYDNHQFVDAARFIAEDPRVRNLGLCNFDTKHMDEILESGVKAVSNQVQFSLIDLRPTFKMLHSCRKYNVKLLTYGSLCGGFLAEKWLGKPVPGLFDEKMTPSHRKYLEMITVWGGWELFQQLLLVLKSVGQKYGSSVSNVAVRWVLDHDYVGAVIIGARMGISENIEDNLKVFSFKLDEDDKASIQAVLDRSKAREVFEAMGDCGAEYRQ